MLTEFVSVQLSREELMELHAALIQRAVLEDRLRGERGQEKIDQRPLLQRIEMLLGESDERLHELDHAIDDELWEHSWYAFTDEWAWFRAKRDVEKELGEAISQFNDAAIEKLYEAKYRKHFEEYVAEVDMLDDVKQSRPAHIQPKA